MCCTSVHLFSPSPHHPPSPPPIFILLGVIYRLLQQIFSSVTQISGNELCKLIELYWGLFCHSWHLLQIANCTQFMNFSRLLCLFVTTWGCRICGATWRTELLFDDDDDDDDDDDEVKLISEVLTRICLTAGVNLLTHNSGRVTQICVFNTVKLGTSASSP